MKYFTKEAEKNYVGSTAAGAATGAAAGAGGGLALTQAPLEKNPKSLQKLIKKLKNMQLTEVVKEMERGAKTPYLKGALKKPALGGALAGAALFPAIAALKKESTVADTASVVGGAGVGLGAKTLADQVAINRGKILKHPGLMRYLETQWPGGALKGLRNAGPWMAAGAAGAGIPLIYQALRDEE